MQRKHILKGKPLELNMYQGNQRIVSCDHSEENPNSEMAPHVIVGGIDAEKLQYLWSVPEGKHHIERELEAQVNAIVNWHHKSDGELALSRSAGELSKGNHSNISMTDWSFVAERALQNLLSEIKIKRRDCLKYQTTWQEICTELQRIREENPNTAIIERAANKVLVVVGREVDVAKVYSEVDTMCIELEQRLQQSSLVFGSPLHKDVFKKTSMENRWRAKYPKLTIEMVDIVIRLQGPVKAILDIERSLKDFFQAVVQVKIELSNGASQVLKMSREQNTQNCIDAFVQSPQKEVALEVNDNIITIVGVREDAEELENIIKNVYNECTFELSTDQQAVFQGDQFKDFIEKQSLQYNGIFHVELNDNKSKIYLVALSEHFDEIWNQMDLWIKGTIVQKESMELVQAGQICYIL